MLDCLQQTIDTVTDYVGLKAIPSLLTLPEEKNAVLLDVPSYSQCDSYSCGATAAWSIVETFHPRANFWKLYKAVDPDEDEGVGTRRVLQALHKFKVGTRIRTKMGWKELRATIDEGFPMLIGTGNALGDQEGDHWSVLYGYGTHPRRVYLGNQPGIIYNQVSMLWREFVDEEWNPSGKAIVCWGK